VSQPHINTWVAGDMVRVDPVTGRYLEDRPDIHHDYPTGEYQRRNAVWDAAESRVTLHAARNEFVAFQVVVAAEGKVEGIEVHFDRLVGPDGAELSGRNLATFKAWYVQVVRPSSDYERISLGPAWYPDALIPVAPGEPVRFDLPDLESGNRLAGAARKHRVGDGVGPSQRNQTVWVDIYVPSPRSEAPPGTYRGVVRVTWPGGEQEISVDLTVWDFALPEETHCRGDIFNVALKDMHPRIEMQYYQMARRHRWQPGVAFYRPDLTICGSTVNIDWRDYDAHMGPYLDGSAFTDEHGYWGPGYGVPIDHLLLPFDCEREARHTAGDRRPADRKRAWPLATPEGGPTPAFESVWQDAARQVKAHFEADPNWRKVDKILFLDGLDETESESDLKKMVYFCQLLRQAMGEGWFKQRIDGRYSREAMEFLHPYVDIWVCHTYGFDPETMAYFKERGVDPWFYGAPGTGSNTFLDLDLLTSRYIGWAAWKYQTGYCQWEFDWNADIAWKEAANFQMRQQYFNGNAQLIYRGEPVGRSGPVPSIRLKAHRRGFQDYEYFWLLDAAGQGELAGELVDSVLHDGPFGAASLEDIDAWSNNPEEWERLRLRAGELLNRLGAE